MHTNISSPDAKRAREVAKLSQSAVAAAVGLNRTYYSLYESGRLALTDSQSSTLVKFLDAHDAGAVLSTETANAQAESADETTSKEPRKPTDNRFIRSSTASHNEPPGPKTSRTKVATQRLIALERTVAIEQTTGRRVPSSIDRTLTSLKRLDYSELFEFTVQRDISLSSIPSPMEFEALDQSKQLKIEAQLEKTIACHAVYGRAWIDCDRRTLYKIACELRRVIPNASKLVPFPFILDEIFESTNEAMATNSRLRIEMAEHLLSCASRRIPIQLPNLRNEK